VLPETHPDPPGQALPEEVQSTQGNSRGEASRRTTRFVALRINADFLEENRETLNAVNQ
jgi:hypothetical protein